MIERIPYYKEGQDIGTFLEPFKYELRRTNVESNRMKEVLASNMPPSVKLKIAHMIDGSTYSYEDFRVKLLEVEGLSI